MFGISIPGMSDATEASPLVDGESSSSSMMPSLFGSTATTPPEGGEASADGSEDHVGLEIGEGQQEVMAIALRYGLWSIHSARSLSRACALTQALACDARSTFNTQYYCV